MKCKKRRNRCGEDATGVQRRSWVHIFCNLMRSPPSSLNYNRIFRASLTHSSVVCGIGIGVLPRGVGGLRNSS